VDYRNPGKAHNQANIMSPALMLCALAAAYERPAQTPLNRSDIKQLKKSTERFEQITPSVVYIYWNSSSSVLIPSNKKDGSIFNS